MIYFSLIVTVVVPVLFALRALKFAPGRRVRLLAWLSIPIVLGAAAIQPDGFLRLVGIVLLVPSLQLTFLYLVAEAFARLSGRELENIITGYIRIEHGADALVCAVSLALITFVPSVFVYRLLHTS